jgi:hypothetical protein
MVEKDGDMPITTRGQVRRWTPTPEQAACLQATEATSRFLHNLPGDIRARYAGQWIAAKGNEVVAAAPTRAELQDRLGEPRDPAVLVLRLERGNTI